MVENVQLSNKKRIISINQSSWGSTGMIMRKIGILAKEAGFEYRCAIPEHNLNVDRHSDDLIIVNDFFRKVNERLAYYSGLNGCMAFLATFLLIFKLKRLKPDLLHLHNLHGSYIHFPLLFYYIRKNNIRVIWTLHDCWAFTGRCPYFTMRKCSRWLDGCHHCLFPKKSYPRSCMNTSSMMWNLKRKCFTGLKNLTIVTPSHWLAGLVKRSFLQEYPVKVIYNGIDLEVFRPVTGSFRQQYHLENKYIILGVAMPLGLHKGLDVMLQLAERLDRNRYQVVLVGNIEEEFNGEIPEYVLWIPRTDDRRKLAEIYSAADVFVNPTREEVLGMVNIEALACGTPVVTFDTGGCPEIVTEECGVVVPCDDVRAMQNAVQRVCEEHLFQKEDCLHRAKEFDLKQRFREYLQLYQEVLKQD